MRPAILFLEQQSWRGGAQYVLEEVLAAVGGAYDPVVAFPQEGPFAETLRRSNIATLCVPLGNYRSGRKSLGETLAFGPRSLACGLKLARVIKKRNVALVYINGPRCLPAGVIAARLTGIPSIFHLHLTLTRAPEIFLAAYTAQATSRVIACSKTAANVLLHALPQLAPQMQVIYNPASARTFPPPTIYPTVSQLSPGNDKHALTVGIVGRITRQKGHHLLLEAAARLGNSLRNLKVVIVGEPAPGCSDDACYQESLLAFARQNGLASSVEWWGYQADLRGCYCRLDSLAIPSEFGEGLPLVVLEAMRFGVPVIGSEIGGIPEVVQDGVNGILIPPGDVDALANALLRLQGDPAFRQQLRAGALGTVDRRFALETFQSAVRGVVYELAPQHGVVDAKPALEHLQAERSSPSRGISHG